MGEGLLGVGANVAGLVGPGNGAAPGRATAKKLNVEAVVGDVGKSVLTLVGEYGRARDFGVCGWPEALAAVVLIALFAWS